MTLNGCHAQYREDLVRGDTKLREDNELTQRVVRMQSLEGTAWEGDGS